MISGERAKLFARVTSREWLYQAWRRVRANRGAAGVDAVSIRLFECDLRANLVELERSLVSGAYQPLPARFVRVLKANGKERELAILAVRDRVAQRAVLDALEPLIEPRLNDCNFAFRPHRSIEAAVQRLVAARANGYVWVFESDVQDFFGAIDRGLLLRELRDVTADERVLGLIGLWLDAGAMNEKAAQRCGGWARRGREGLASLRLLLGETVSESLDGMLAERLGVGGMVDNVELYGMTDFDESEMNRDAASGGASGDDVPSVDSQAEAKRRVRRAAVKQLLRDGALVALSQRALLGRVVGAKALGIGGVALAAAVATPALRELYRQRFNPARGTLQGAPVSPLLTNLYMTPFDDALTEAGWRLIRYCDDFVIPCRTSEEAEAARAACVKALRKRRLSLHPEKTRIVEPGAEFEFLGYTFHTNGSVTAPPSTPARLAREISEQSRRSFRRAVREAEAVQQRTSSTANGIWRRLRGRKAD